MQRVQRSILLTALLAGCAVAGAANAQVIRITNVNSPTGHDIPLKANSSVQIDSAGNLLAECALNSSNVCTQLSAGGGTTNPNAPTVALSRVDTDTSVTAGETVRVAWSSTNAEVCKASSTGPSASWSGSRENANASGELLTLGAQGTYALSIVCYNASGASPVSTVSVSVGAAPGGEVPPPSGTGCNITSSDPAFNPSNFAKVMNSWQARFSSPDGNPVAVYPGGVSFPVPAGSNKGSYQVIPFVPNPNESIVMFFDQIQSRPADQITARPAEGMFFSISPCQGDVRNWTTPSDPDHFLRPGCRKFESTAALVWSTSATYPESNGQVCKLVAGQTYYLHIMPANPADGLLTGEHSCSSATASSAGCDVGVVFQTSGG